MKNKLMTTLLALGATLGAWAGNVRVYVDTSTETTWGADRYMFAACGSTPLLATWPGLKITTTATKSDGSAWHYVDINATGDFHVIVNDGNGGVGHQTEDIGISAIADGKAYFVSKAGGSGYTVNAVEPAAPAVERTYCVIDISGGPDAANYPVKYMDALPPEGWFNTEEYKTTKLVLRKIDAGTFTMGSPTGEVGHQYDETQHEVTITNPFYMGIFEVTQKQYQLVTGNAPSEHVGDMRPVENVSWNTLRGNSATYSWPSKSTVDPASFIGKLRAKTACEIDLPTEAQWEYSCRAGTSTALNSGDDLAAEQEDAAMNDVGRYAYNNGCRGGIQDGKGGYLEDHTTVGSYNPNAWGLYDMHGNVGEWCLDWYNSGYYASTAVTNPVGPASGSDRVYRGGAFVAYAYFCRSAHRTHVKPNESYGYVGLRLCSAFPCFVTFDENFEGGSTTNISFLSTSKVLANAPAVSARAGWTFGGWYTEDGKRVAEADTPVDGATYYAHWTWGIDLAALTADYVAQDGDILSGTLDGSTQKYKISIADGATVTLSNAVVNGVVYGGSCQWAGITCEGDATTILEGDNAVKGFHMSYPGIYVPSGKTLTIQGGGSLDASSNGSASGIGGGSNLSCGNIVIEGGTITAAGGSNSAGIGGGNEGGCGNITISGGSVTATGNYGAGIGAGYNSEGACSNITITGGIVVANGGGHSAGIGSGHQSPCGNIVISGGTVTATGGDLGAGIGSGSAEYALCADITISGGTVTATGGYGSAGIGGGDSSCGNVTITEGVTKVTATKGDDAPYSIGQGRRGISSGMVVVGGRIGSTADQTYVYPSSGMTDLAGSGTQADPYLIGDYAGLLRFAGKVNGGATNAWATVTNDIVVTATDWMPIACNYNSPYVGTFDGANHVISALSNVSSSSAGSGLFGNVGVGGTVRNVRLVNVDINGGGSVVGLENYGVVENCRASGTIAGDGTTGGIVGSNYGGTVRNCLSACTVSSSDSNSWVGGIAGYNEAGGTIENCSNTGFVTLGNWGQVGGIVGVNWGVVKDCCNSGAVGTTRYDTDTGVGGIAGFNGNKVENCYNVGEATSVGGASVGGIAGSNHGSDTVPGEISNCNYLASLAVSRAVGKSSGNTSSNARALSAAEFVDEANFPGWDFDAVWYMDANAPQLWALAPDQIFADKVVAAIDAIGDVAYTDESKAKIDAARAAYNALTDAQKALVANYATLTAAEAAYAALAPAPVEPEPVPAPCYAVIDEGDITEPYAADKAVTILGAVYDGCDVVGIVELKLGKVNAKKGTSKVSGSVTTLDGKKHAAKGVNVDGIDGTAPATVSLEVKGLGTMAVTIGGDKFAGSLGAYHVQSASVGGAWAGGSAVAAVEPGDLSAFAGTVLSDFLPTNEVAEVSGGKWSFAKAASVKWAKPKGASEKELVVDTSKGKNLSGLKLTYTPKKGTFKGSFSVYALEGAGSATKLKKHKLNVSGVVVGGVGYGVATSKKPAVSWPVTVK